jgi:hypothetical protein
MFSLESCKFLLEEESPIWRSKINMKHYGWHVPMVCGQRYLNFSKTLQCSLNNKYCASSSDPTFLPIKRIRNQSYLHKSDEHLNSTNYFKLLVSIFNVRTRYLLHCIVFVSWLLENACMKKNIENLKLICD